MTKEEAAKVVSWCEENELLRPDVELRDGDYILTWISPFDSGNLITSVYQSARYWCMVMKSEHDSGVVGYWETG